MKTKLLWFFALCMFMSFNLATAQEVKNEPQEPVWSSTLTYKFVPSIQQQIKDGTFIPSEPISDRKKMGKDKRWHGNKVVPGKGLPKGADPLVESSNRSVGQRAIKAPSLVFETATNTSTPSDPTGAVGPNHYIASWNTAWRVFNKDGTPATPEASLATLFGEAPGDPVVLYDTEADRYVVTQFSGSPNGFHVAISQTNDPTTGGWHVYSSSDFQTGAFPDYTKFSIWSDAYYVTANITGGNGQVWAIERDKMLTGDATASIQAFNLPGIVTNGFYSPQVFNITGGTHPATGNATIVYMQDDAWAGVTSDHLKLWNLDIDWVTPGNSTISAATQIATTAFTGVFDGGGFSNLSQPSGPDIDAMQATIMNQAQFRKFGTHNSAVFNFVVNAAGGGGELAAVRWYEMRQTGDGQPWTIYQEGTYTAPDGRHAFAASMAMNSTGDIGMGYTSLSNTESISIRYTGRFDGDALGVMTANEELIAQSTADNTNLRYADYTHLTVDPTDDSFWHVSEYFNTNRRDIVGVFTLTPPSPNDVGVTSIDAPNDGLLGAAESITVSIRNFGTNPQSNIPVSYTIDGGTAVNGTYAGTIAPGVTESYTFTQTADLSVTNQTYTIVATTGLANDDDTSNDSASKDVTNALQYCEPQSDCSFNDGVTLLQIGTIDHTSAFDCGADTDGYINSTAVSTDLDRASGNNVHTGNLQVGYNGDEAAIWIDFNDDGDFEDAGELVLNAITPTGADTDTAFNITIPTDANMGTHRMRVRGWDPGFTAAGILLNPCDDLTYGRTEDFTVNIVDTSLSINDFTLDGSDFSIITLPNDQYEIILKTSYTKDLSFSVFNVLGQQVVFNNISKEGGEYRYQLDMSYASSGVYVVKLGKGDVFETGKIIVE